jgi:hypothetical protein
MSAYIAREIPKDWADRIGDLLVEKGKLEDEIFCLRSENKQLKEIMRSVLTTHGRAYDYESAMRICFPNECSQTDREGK